MEQPITALKTPDCALLVSPVVYRGEFLMTATKFSGLTLFAFIIASVKFHYL